MKSMTRSAVDAEHRAVIARTLALHGVDGVPDIAAGVRPLEALRCAVVEQDADVDGTALWLDDLGLAVAGDRAATVALAVALVGALGPRSPWVAR